MYTWNILDDMFSVRALVERALGESPSNRERGLPAINVSETETASQVQALLPGLTRDEIEISFEKGFLTISSAECQENENDQSKERKIREEHCKTEFRRSLRFSREIDQEKITAQLENGVLTITLPYRAETAPRKIEVL